MLTSALHLTLQSKLPPFNTKATIVASLHFPLHHQKWHHSLFFVMFQLVGSLCFCHAARDDIITRPSTARQNPFGAERAVISIMSTPWVNLTRHMAVPASSQPLSLPSLLLLIISIKEEKTGEGVCKEGKVMQQHLTWLQSLKKWCV